MTIVHGIMSMKKVYFIRMDYMEKENMNKYVRIKKSITTILLASTLAVFGG